jgi:hypothetical protein
MIYLPRASLLREWLVEVDQFQIQPANLFILARKIRHNAR